MLVANIYEEVKVSTQISGPCCVPRPDLWWQGTPSLPYSKSYHILEKTRPVTRIAKALADRVPVFAQQLLAPSRWFNNSNKVAFNSFKRVKRAMQRTLKTPSWPHKRLYFAHRSDTTTYHCSYSSDKISTHIYHPLQMMVLHLSLHRSALNVTAP